MRVMLYIVVVLSALSVSMTADELSSRTPADPAEQTLPANDGGDHYGRWIGSSKSELVEFWGKPHKVKRKGDERVLIYQLRVTCDGMITGTQYSRLGKGIVTGSQDPLDSIENNVPQGATRRAGSRVAARKTVRFFVDAAGSVSRYEATETKTYWKRCKY